MEVQKAHLLCRSAKHVCIKADSVLKSHPEKPKNTSKVWGECAGKQCFSSDYMREVVLLDMKNQ